MKDDLDQVIIKQHDLARKVEETFGKCKLSEDMRRIADMLSTLNSPLKITNSER